MLGRDDDIRSTNIIRKIWGLEAISQKNSFGCLGPRSVNTNTA